MKKIFMFFSLAICSVFAFAEDVVQVEPMHVQAGQGFDGDELSYEEVVSINLCNSVPCAGFQFDINVPAGMLVDFDTEGCTRVKYTKKGSKYTWFHTATSTDVKESPYPGYDRYSCSVSNQVDGTCFIGESGEDALNMYFAVPETLADGVYPIYFTRIYFSDENDNLIVGGTATSYMIVGEGKGTLVMEGQIPSFVNETLATEDAITSLDLTNVTASHGTFAYVPGRDVVAPETEVLANVSATVAPKGTTYASLCLPFKATGLNNCFTLSEVKDSYATFTEVENLDAGTAAIISGEVTAIASNVALAGVAKDVKTSGYYVKNDQLVNVNGFNATIPALRGWWDMPAGVRGFVLEGEETAINAIDANEAETIYNVAGVRLNKAQRGVNIVNGKKVVIK